MKRTVTSFFLIVVLATLTIALSACSGDKEVSASSSITIGISQDLDDGLDPLTVVGAGTREVFFNLYEGLVKPDSDGNLIPAVASAYSVSEDGLSYTFTLRDGVKFHDGSAVTVEDIVYSIKRCADADNTKVPALSLISEIQATDDKTVVLTLSEPNSDFLTAISSVYASIIPQSNPDPAKNAIGTGPYKYVSRSPQENFVVERFDEYWGEKGNIKDVTFKIVANADTIVMNLNSGAVDLYAHLTDTMVSQLSDSFETLEGTSNLVQAMYLNNAVEPFNKKEVRQALCYAVDKTQILELLADGHGTQIGSSMFPAFGKYYMEELNDVYPHDVEKAKELLSEAGYPDGFTFTITVPSNYTPHVDTAQVIVEQLKEVNVNAQIALVDWDTWLSDVYSGRQFEATVVGVDASTLCANALLSRFESTAGNNFVNFSNAAYDEAYKNANTETDDEIRTSYYKTCEEILTNEAANVYIQDMPEFVAINKKYTGYTFYPLYVIDLAKLSIVE